MAADQHSKPCLHFMTRPGGVNFDFNIVVNKHYFPLHQRASIFFHLIAVAWSLIAPARSFSPQVIINFRLRRHYVIHAKANTRMTSLSMPLLNNKRESRWGFFILPAQVSTSSPSLSLYVASFNRYSYRVTSTQILFYGYWLLLLPNSIHLSAQPCCCSYLIILLVAWLNGQGRNYLLLR